jgi:hypothetical protein
MIHKHTHPAAQRFYYGHETAKATYQGARNAIKLALLKCEPDSAEHAELTVALECLKPATYLGWDGQGASG